MGRYFRSVDVDLFFHSTVDALGAPPAVENPYARVGWNSQTLITAIARFRHGWNSYPTKMVDL